jgi:hypothetical protein
MREAVKVLALVCLLATSTYAADSIKEFSFKTVDGKIIEYKAGSSAMVVNIGSHW